MIAIDDKLHLDDLKIGMRLKASQLSEIYDNYIILTNVKLVKNELGIGTFEGTIDTISKSEVTLTKPHSTLIYNDSYEKEDYCTDILIFNQILLAIIAVSW